MKSHARHRAQSVALVVIVVVAVTLAAGVIWRSTQSAPVSSTATQPVEEAPETGPVWASTSGRTYTLGYRIAKDRWWLVDLTEINDNPGAFPLHQLDYSAVVSGVDDGIIKTEAVTLDTPSAYEYAGMIADRGEDQFVGNFHGYDEETGIVATVDGQPVSRMVTSGNEATITRKSVLHRPSTGQPIARVITTYRMTADGLRVDWRMKWLQPTTITVFYPAMFPLGETFTSGQLGTTTLDLTRGIGHAADDQHQPVPTASASTRDGLTATLTVDDPDVTLDGWRHSGPDGQAFIEDREGNEINKVYMTRVSLDGGPVDVAPGDVWTSSATYAVQMD